MQKPIKGYKNSLYPEGHVTQWFGENRQLYFERLGMEGHNGIDIVAPWGTPIYAVMGGLVADVKDNPDGYGKHLRILTDPDAGGYGDEWVYGHNSRNLVKVGQRVVAGQMIAEMGNTGFVVSGATPFWKHNPYAGTHLHLGLRKYRMNPVGFQYNDITPKISTINHHNGFFGSIDFKDLLDQAESPLPTDEEEVKKGMMLTIISLLQQIISVLKNTRV